MPEFVSLFLKQDERMVSGPSHQYRVLPFYNLLNLVYLSVYKMIEFIHNIVVIH